MAESWRDDRWAWGEPAGRDSIDDAEQLLLLLLLPATKVSQFPPEDAGEMGEEGLLSALLEYYTEYEDSDGTPVFSAGRRLGPSELEVVPAYAVSVTLSLATLGFAKIFQTRVSRRATRDRLDDLLERAGDRLTAALVGLLRSFAVHVFDAGSPPGEALIAMVNQAHLPRPEVVARLRDELRPTIESLGEVLIGSGQNADLDDAKRLFECGWSGGVVEGAPRVETTEQIGRQPAGVAEPTVYLTFTTAAVDAVEELWSERTRVLGLLNEEQQRLTRALRLRADLTRSYWATVATFGAGRWPVEDRPWRSTGGESSDYLTLQVASLAIKDRGADLARLGRVLTELADRDPRLTLRLNGSDWWTWTADDFAPLLLRRIVEVAALLADTGARNDLLAAADAVWDQIVGHRQQVTEPAVAALVAAAGGLPEPLPQRQPIDEFAAELLREADHLYDRELLAGPDRQEKLAAIEVSLRRARALLAHRPGTAAVLANEVLARLDELAATRASQENPG